jgi:hypothetical protein
MVLQSLHARVGSGSQRLGASSRVPQLEAEKLKEAPRQRQQIGAASGLPAQRFASNPEHTWSLGVDDADDRNSGAALSRVRIVRDGP